MQNFTHYTTRCQSWLTPQRYREGWQKLMNARIGIIPLPIYGLIAVCMTALIALDKMPSEISVVLAVLAVLGFGCAELGRCLPGLKQIGGPVIVTILLPSCLVHYQLVPVALVRSIEGFWHTTNILYLFTVGVIVGGILSMDRQVLIKGFVKLFIPLAAGSAAAAMIGTLTGMALGLDARHTFFYIVVPIMAGGLGEGAIPLTLGYAAILNISQPELFAQVTPPIVLGNLCAIVCATVLHRFGERFPQYSTGRCLSASHLVRRQPHLTPTTMESLAVASMAALSFYMVGVLVNQFTGWPAPIVMLGLAILVKLTCAISPQLEDGAGLMHHFFAKAAAYPILFGIGLTLTPWQALITALTPVYLITIFVTVLTLALTGLLVGRWAGLNPIESAIINVCHSGMGSVGDMAILTSAHRMHLMPFAQLATRIGGVLTIVIALMMFSQWPM